MRRLIHRSHVAQNAICCLSYRSVWLCRMTTWCALGSRLCTKVLGLGFLCATSVSSVSLWCGFTRNSSTTETQRTQRLHREERDRDFLCKPASAASSCCTT